VGNKIGFNGFIEIRCQIPMEAEKSTNVILNFRNAAISQAWALR